MEVVRCRQIFIPQCDFHKWYSNSSRVFICIFYVLADTWYTPNCRLCLPHLSPLLDFYFLFFWQENFFSVTVQFSVVSFSFYVCLFLFVYELIILDPDSQCGFLIISFEKNLYNLWIFSPLLSIIFTGVGIMGSRYETQAYSCGWHGPRKWNALPFSLLARGDVLNPTCGNLWVTQVAVEGQEDFPFHS